MAMGNGDIVKTVYGEGRVVSERGDGTIVVVLESWRLANATRPTLYLNKASVSTVDRAFAVGQDVKTVYGEATILEVRDADYVATTTHWKLANDTNTKLYLAEASMTPATSAQETYEVGTGKAAAASRVSVAKQKSCSCM